MVAKFKPPNFKVMLLNFYVIHDAKYKYDVLYLGKNVFFTSQQQVSSAVWQP
jgi:hypothetical protein